MSTYSYVNEYEIRHLFFYSTLVNTRVQEYYTRSLIKLISIGTARTYNIRTGHITCSGSSTHKRREETVVIAPSFVDVISHTV